MKKWATLLTIALVCVTASRAHGEKNNKKNEELVIGTYYASSGGKSSSEKFDVTRSLLEIINTEYDMNIRIEKYASLAEVSQAFLDNKIDAAGVSPDIAVEILDEGGNIYPWATFVVKKRRKTAYCLWRKKDNVKNDISKIAGSSFLSNDYTTHNLVLLRNFLHEKGIDRPLYKIFKSFVKVPSYNSAIVALTIGDADFYWTNEDSDTILKLLNPGVVEKLTKGECTDRAYARLAIVINKKIVSDQIILEMDEIFKDFIKNQKSFIQNYPVLKAGLQYMKLAEIKFIHAKNNEFQVDFNLYKKSKDNGWLKEAQFIVDKMEESSMGKTIEIKPDYKMCKVLCSEDKDRDVCMDECME